MGIWAGSGPGASLSLPEEPAGSRDRADRSLWFSDWCLMGDKGSEGAAVNLIKGSRKTGSWRQAGY